MFTGLTGRRPTGIRGQAPCFTCPAYHVTPREKCWDQCNMLFRWNEARISRAAAKQTKDALNKMEQEVNKEVKEFKSAFDESGAGVLSEREEYSDEELSAMADEIFADLEKEE